MITPAQMFMYVKEADMSNFARQPPRYSVKQGHREECPSSTQQLSEHIVATIMRVVILYIKSI